MGKIEEKVYTCRVVFLLFILHALKVKQSVKITYISYSTQFSFLIKRENVKQVQVKSCGIFL